MEEMEREKGPWEGQLGEIFLYLDRKARVWASQKIPNSADAELAEDKAMAYLLDQYLRGDPPRKPFAWLEAVIDRLAMKLRQGKKGMRSLDEDVFREVFSTVDSLHNQLNPPEERELLEQARQYFDSIREELEKLLTKRQLLALKVFMRVPSLKKAARELGVSLGYAGKLLSQIIKVAKKLKKRGNPPP